MMKKITFFIPICMVFFFALCSEEKWQGEIYKEQDVIVIENKGKGLWEEPPLKEVRFIEDLSIGEETGNEYLLFRNELDVAVCPKGNIYILDIGNQRVLKFDKKGEFIWETGRKGQGPGEFQSRPSQYAYSISLTPSEDIAVQDEKRIHFFNKKGEFQKTLKIDRRIWAFDFFNNKGQFLGSHVLKERELRFIDDKGFFYFSESSPYPRVIRARLFP